VDIELEIIPNDCMTLEQNIDDMVRSGGITKCFSQYSGAHLSTYVTQRKKIKKTSFNQSEVYLTFSLFGKV